MSSSASSSLVFGGGQEHGVRPGTENVAGIVGLGAAAELAGSRLAEESVRLCSLRNELWRRLQQRVPTLIRHTPKESSLPNTLTFSFPGVLGKDVLSESVGVVASTGSACHSGVDTPAETLLAMQVPADVALGAVRISLGRSTSEADVSRSADILVTAYEMVARY
jgi:cysteine desulfurase